MKLLRCMLPGLLAVFCIGAAETPPVLSVTVGDGARLIKRFENSLYAKLWNERSMEAMRQKTDDWLAEIEKTSGVNPLDVVKALRSCDIQISKFTIPQTDADPLSPKAVIQAPEPAIIAQADLGDYAEKLMALILKSGDDSERITIPGADEAIGNKEGKEPAGKYSIARYGTRLVLGANQAQPPSPYSITAEEADVVISIDYKRFISEMAAQTQDQEQKAVLDSMQKMEQFLQPFTWDVTILPEGIRERMTQANSYPGLIPVDRTLFAHLPANTQMAYTMGIDSKAYWDVLEPVLIDLLANQGTPLTQAQIQKQVEDTIAQFGLQLNYDDVKNILSGTILMSVSPGAPFPSVTLALPRSKALDALIGIGAGMQQIVLPEEGNSAQINLQNVPLPITVILDKSYWVISSDPQIATAWSAQDGGWSNSPAVKTVFEQAPNNAVILGASDTPAVLRAAGGFLPFIPFTDAKDKQLATVLLARSAGAASTGYIFATSSSEKWTVEARGIMGFGVVPIVTAIAIPAILKSTESSNEMAAATSLKSGVFPAQIQFQAGNYLDQNEDGIGDYGFFSEMAGGPINSQGDDIRLNLLPPAWNASYPTLNGYTFACWLPDGKGGALGASEGVRKKIDNPTAIKHPAFVAYAWPNNDDGMVFAITHTGILYAKPALEVEISETGPKWNDLFDGMGWESAATWTPYKKK